MDNKQNEVITKKKRFPFWIIIAAVIIIVAGTAGGIAVANAVSPARKWLSSWSWHANMLLN